MIGIPGSDCDQATTDLLNEVPAGGICLFARNIRTAEQILKLLQDISQLSLIRPMIAIDQEGGMVDRLRRIVTPISPAGAIKDGSQASEMGTIIGHTLKDLGIDIDFAPVVDVVDDGRAGSSNGLFTRPFGSTKEETLEFAGAFLRALQKTGVVGCLKHFPGLGAAKVDSHERLPVIDIDRNVLESIDLYPYKKLFETSDVKSVMVAHAAFPNTDLQEMSQNGKLLPASLSRRFIDGLLREQLGFDGVVITDDLEMGAVVNEYGIAEACIMAINAGADMLAICAGQQNIRDGYHGVLDAVNDGRIPIDRIDESLIRLNKIRSLMGDERTANIENLQTRSTEIEAFNSRVES